MCCSFRRKEQFKKRLIDFLTFLLLNMGVQILGRALGGRTGRARSGWDIGFRTVHLSSPSTIFSTLKLPGRLSIIECHRDEVSVVHSFFQPLNN